MFNSGKPIGDLSFNDFFKKATDNDPYPFQMRLATGEQLPELIDVPTGMGKTDAVVLAWLWRRRFDSREKVREDTPRRLVYCLPMRVLVEQTRDKAKMWLDNLGMLAKDGAGDVHPVEGWAADHGDEGSRVAVTVLMGGEDKDEWDLYPERDAIIIGTQDMLLSRALNRGYGMSRYRWPVHFGLLNNDCLWVMDEVQLMGSGVSTTTQLQAWRKELRLPPNADIDQTVVECPVFGPTRSMWMSATLHPEWLKSVDFEKWVSGIIKLRLEPEDKEKVAIRYKAKKTCSKAKNPPKGGSRSVAARQEELPKAGDDGYEEAVARFVELKHNNKRQLTLVILNTVDRAVKVHTAIKDRIKNIETILIHSRFRPHERQDWAAFFDKEACKPENLPEYGRIIVSTQVVEAGVDISARVLMTELAPWASLIQRIGRANRYGEFNEEGGAEIYWLDVSDKASEPYDEGELEKARKELPSIAEDASPKSIEDHRNKMEKDDQQKLQELLPYKPQFVPRDKDLFELFDTTPDLTGADIDVSRYIRDGSEHDVSVFWREVKNPNNKPQVQESRGELCPVPFYGFQNALRLLRGSGRIWRWDYLDGRWANLHQGEEERVYPGQIFLLEKACGGYSESNGWTGKPEDRPIWTGINPSRMSQERDSESIDSNSLAEWQEIAYHTNAVRAEVGELLSFMPGLNDHASVLGLAARLHDWGKAAEAFQSRIKKDNFGKERLLLAKAPDEAWLHWTRWDRPVFRHELASALAILETVFRTNPAHPALAMPYEDIISLSGVKIIVPTDKEKLPENGVAKDIVALSEVHLNLLTYLVCAHHGKVRLSLRASPKDLEENSFKGRQARGVRDGEVIPECDLAGPMGGSVRAPRLELYLDPMEAGLSPRYGPSWQERTITLRDSIGPFRLAYLEAIFRAADWRASK